MTLRAIVLGSAAGGGFPQWNAADEAARRARSGDPAARPRTQASLAVSADGERWVLLNAAPELRLQIEATPALHPRMAAGRVRHSPIAAVVLTGGEVDTIAGLLSLRERQALALYAARPVLQVLDDNPIFGVLDRGLVPRRELATARSTALLDADGTPLGLTCEAFAVPGKVPLFLEGGVDPGRSEDGDTIGLAVSAGGAELLFIPGCAALTPALKARIARAHTLFFDGTLFRDDEMIRSGAGSKTGARMGHMSLDGPQGTLALLDGVAPARRILIHLNTTNPVLLADSAERAAVTRAGWLVAEDGMEIEIP